MEQLPENDHIWNRKLIHLLWWILLIYEVAAMIGFLFDIYDQPTQWFHSFLQFQVIPTSLQLSLMGAGYLAVHFLKRYSDFIMIIWTMTMVCIYIMCIPELMGSYELISIPIILSSVYFQKKHIIFAYSLGIASLTALLISQAYKGSLISPPEIIIALTVLTATALVSFAIMTKGLSLIEQLKASVLREQDLLIRNVMIDRLSKVDALTELFNHRSFQEHTDHLISHMPYDAPLELALMDIDNFKKINDTYGHWVGDVVLKTIGGLLKDMLGPDDMSFRYGGEEFAVLFVGKSHSEVLAVCEAFMQIIRETEIPEMPGQPLTMSIGLAPYNRNTMKKAWFQQVDECLYIAKRNGKNCIHTYLSGQYT
ncbi:GGDEF domain-containing protein [Paenibacillus aceris]|uniref:Diguanylate cyclase (GGDEF)-like protein n=1 Tax=Paenibacillus aceris TaxID=869555 RepID=A0ABS4I603_9BACL|nr:GGDEF domain-containing protein [Paenibacillus aceris]MBP1966343.1 diguanylate cyclase (GGDEF)-like protein [Paenibacillus aceris]NHW38601.1 GGDEF domain-containing protein [Paenibacillus aceris]